MGEYICLYFATWGPKKCFHWGSVQWSEKFVDGLTNMGLLKKKTRKNYEHTHELINMNHTIPYTWWIYKDWANESESNSSNHCLIPFCLTSGFMFDLPLSHVNDTLFW